MQWQQMYIPSGIMRDIASQTNSQMHFNMAASPKDILLSLTIFVFSSNLYKSSVLAED
jgi:hypothetical protein